MPRVPRAGTGAPDRIGVPNPALLPTGSAWQCGGGHVWLHVGHTKLTALVGSHSGPCQRGS